MRKLSRGSWARDSGSRSAVCTRGGHAGSGQLVAELSGVPERAPDRTVTVCDPTAGSGDVLAAVADAVGPDYQLIFQAADADRYLARLAGRRMAMHGVALTDLNLAAARSARRTGPTRTSWAPRSPHLPGETRSPEQVVDRIDEIALGSRPATRRSCSARPACWPVT